VLDLRDLTFIDSSGMRVIVDASLRARRAERELILVRGPSHVDRVFRLIENSNGLEIRDLDPLEPPVQVLPQVAQEDHAA
jgi:anti-sigma B factor antagonist